MVWFTNHFLIQHSCQCTFQAGLGASWFGNQLFFGASCKPACACANYIFQAVLVWANYIFQAGNLGSLLEASCKPGSQTSSKPAQANQFQTRFAQISWLPNKLSWFGTGLGPSCKHVRACLELWFKRNLVSNGVSFLDMGVLSFIPHTPILQYVLCQQNEGDLNYNILQNMTKPLTS